jgi:hypothetical protein
VALPIEGDLTDIELHALGMAATIRQRQQMKNKLKKKGGLMVVWPNPLYLYVPVRAGCGRVMGCMVYNLVVFR